MSEPNQPCPCGSGKKYKHCCQRAKSNEGAFESTQSEFKPHAGAVEKAMDWLVNRHRKGWTVSFERLRDELLNPSEREKLSQLDGETLSGVQINLTEWLLAEGEIQTQGSNRRISDYLIGPSGPNWTVGQREWLQQLGQRPLRLYNVTDVIRGEGMTLCDTLNADAAPMVVRDRSASQGLEPGMYLGCRVMREGEYFQLSGATYLFSMLHGPVVANSLRTTAKEFGPLPGLAKKQGLVLMSAWLKQFVSPPPMPTMVDMHSGEPIVLITDHYHVLDWESLARTLQGCADVEGNQMEGWSRIIDCDDGQIRPLAHINLGEKKDQIEIFYKTQTQADQGRAWFDGLTAGAVAFLKRKVTDSKNIRSQSNAPQADAGMGLPDIDPQELTRAMAEIVKRTYANWADEPIPALNNKTPRLAIQTASGLERVKGLLRSYESGEKAQAAQQGRSEISYDFLWQSLGVSR